MPPLGFELTIPAGERLQTYVLDRAATGTGNSRMTEAAYIINKMRIGITNNYTNGWHPPKLKAPLEN
jgi:hypothetical protein